MPQLSAFGYGVPKDPTKQLVTSGPQFEAMVRQLEGKAVRVFDHETTGTAWYKHARSCGLGLGCFNDHGEMQSWYVPYRHNTGEHQLDIGTISPAIQQLFADPYVTWVAHNFKFDEHFNRKEGWFINGRRYCTQMGARLWNENDPLKLKHRAVSDLARPYADEWEKKVDIELNRLARERGLGKKAYLYQYGYSEVQIDLLGYYGCYDIDFTGSLYGLYEGWGLSSNFSGIWNTEMEMLEVLCDIEEWGLPVNVVYLEKLRDVLTQRMQVLKHTAHQHLGGHMFDLGNDDQLREFLYEKLRLPWAKKTPKGDKLSVDAEVLGWFIDRHPVMPIIKEYRDAKKIVTTWTDSILEKLDEHHILHGSLKSDGTTTGRLSSGEPNLQNFAHDDDIRAMNYSGKLVEDGGIDPWSIRRAFVMRPGMVRLYYDYSQIELRMIAFYTGDPIMVQTYIEDGDIHARTQQEIGVVLGMGPIKRRPAKVINFGLSYGLSATGLSRQAKIPEGDARKFMNAFLSRYIQVVQYREWFWHKARQQGCQFTNIYGRPRRLPHLALPKEDKEDRWRRKRAERQSFGSLIQGTAADLMKRKMVALHKWIKAYNLPMRLCGNVHDEAWLDCPQAYVRHINKPVRDIMEDAAYFAPIPIVVDGKISTINWCEQEKLAA